MLKISNIPSYLIIFCLLIQCLFGIDFGFSSVLKKKIRNTVKCITLFMSLFYIIVLFGPLSYAYKDMWFWYSYTFFEYASYFFVLRTVKYTFCNYATDVGYSYRLSENENIFLKFFVFVCSIAILLIKIVFLTINCMYETYSGGCLDFSVPFYALYCIPCLGIDAIAVVQFIIPYYIYCYVKNLKKYLKKSVVNLDYFEKRYRAIADCFDKAWPMISKITFLELIIGIPKLMSTVWFMLHYIKAKYGWYSYMTEYVFATHMFVQICFPAIVTEMINSQIDAIKSILNEQLMTQVDPCKEAELLRMLRYLQARKLRRRVLRFIPMDMRQLVALCSICTTYFIIIIQFTHLYD